MKEGIGEIGILNHKGERIDSIIVDYRYHGYFLARERSGAGDTRKATSLKSAKADFTPAEGVLSINEAYLVFNYLEFSHKEVAEVLEVNPSTLFRWKKNVKEVFLGELQAKAVLYIDEIIAKGVKLFDSEENFQVWLNEPNYALGGKKPIELLKDHFEVEKVNNAIEEMSWGNLMKTECFSSSNKTPLSEN